jgi:kynureninase
MTDALARFRSRFPILETTTYLVSHSLGAMPAEAKSALEEYADTWATRGVRAWGDRWWMMSIEVGDLIAPLLGAPPSSVTMLPNVTTAEAVIISATRFTPPRNRVVMVEGEFPSVIYLYERLARRLGAEIVTIPASGLGVDEERIIEAIDGTTALVALSHVLFQSSFRLDAAAIARRCREAGALMVLDVFQSAGVTPVQLREWDVPIATGGVLKWLCGGPGGGYLYVDPELRPRLEPALTGWMAHENPFAFDPAAIRFRDDPLRFAIGTPAVPALYAAGAGPRIVAEAGIDAIRANSLRQTARIIELADARGWEVRTPRDDARRGGSVAIGVPHAREVAAGLNERDILCDFRPRSGIRLSPHFYTLDREIGLAFDAADEILASGSWRGHEAPSTVT